MFGTTVFLRFRFDAGDAMGMNMATIACDRVVTELIEPETGSSASPSRATTASTRSRPHINFQEGRGKRIFAEVVLEGGAQAGAEDHARDLVEVAVPQEPPRLDRRRLAGLQRPLRQRPRRLLHRHRTGPGPRGRGLDGRDLHRARGPEAVYASIYLPAVPIGAVGGGTGSTPRARRCAARRGSTPSARAGRRGGSARSWAAPSSPASSR
jgi:hydroxymethylglutaryl-CoA reductase (NADPH)